MPLYDFKCKDCGHVQTERMSIADMEAGTIRECKECQGESSKTFTANYSEFMSPESLGRHKPPSDFRNFLSAVKKAHPGCAIRDH